MAGRPRSWVEDLKLELQSQRRDADLAYEPEYTKKFTPWPQFNNTNPGFDDRRDEAWPHHPVQRDQEFKGDYSISPSAAAKFMGRYDNIAPVTPMGNALGLQEILAMEEFQRKLGPPQEIPPSRGGTVTHAMPDAVVPPPEPQGWDKPLPDISVDSFNQPPRVNMGVTLPTSAGDFSARGEMTNPKDWKALFGFRVPF